MTPLEGTPEAQSQIETATMALMRMWREEDATDDLEEIRATEADLLEFKRNMNLPRKIGGMRLLLMRCYLNDWLTDY